MKGNMKISVVKVGFSIAIDDGTTRKLLTLGCVLVLSGCLRRRANGVLKVDSRLTCKW